MLVPAPLPPEVPPVVVAGVSDAVAGAAEPSLLHPARAIASAALAAAANVSERTVILLSSGQGN
jgi:hypothetical protein